MKNTIPDHNGMKLGIINRRKTGGKSQMWKLNSIQQPICQWQKSHRKFENTLRWMKIKTQYAKIYGMWKYKGVNTDTKKKSSSISKLYLKE